MTKRKKSKRKSRKKQKRTPKRPSSLSKTPFRTLSSKSSVLSSLSSLSSSPFSSPSWKTWWDVLVPAISVFVSTMDKDLTSRQVTLLENITACLNVLSDTIGGSRTRIRKATSRLTESIITGEHVLAFSRLKLYLVKLGFSSTSFRDGPLKVNMKPTEMFDLNQLKNDMRSVLESVSRSSSDQEKKDEVGRAFDFFNSAVEVVRSIEESIRTLDLSSL